MYKTFLIKYAEIAIKGKNRYIFEDALVKNIKYQLRNVDGSFEVRKESGRVYVETDGDYDYDETVATLSRILAEHFTTSESNHHFRKSNLTKRSNTIANTVHNANKRGCFDRTHCC